MKIIKSFTDENGQEVLVQGAGTVYNQELNSLAIGEGTRAIGENQFVCGRYNEPQIDKVEVVGGGETVEQDYTKYELGEEIKEFGQYLTSKSFFYGGVTIQEAKIALNVITNVPIENITLKSNFIAEEYWNTRTFFIITMSHYGSTQGVVGYHLDLIAFNPEVNLWNSASLYIDGKWRFLHKDITEDSYITLDQHLASMYDNEIPFMDRVKEALTVEISSKNIRTLDWEGNEVLAGELTSKKVNTQSVKWEDDTYSRQIDSQEASLMPKIVEISSQMVEATNPITQNKVNFNVPNISQTGMLAQSNKFLKLVVNEESTKTIWEQQQLTNSAITFRNVKTSLIDNVFWETIIEINYALDLPTASVMHKVADLQIGDIQYYLNTQF